MDWVKEPHSREGKKKICPRILDQIINDTFVGYIPCLTVYQNKLTIPYVNEALYANGYLLVWRHLTADDVAEPGDERWAGWRLVEGWK